MIRTDKEYQSALRKLKQNKEAIDRQRERLQAMSLSQDQLDLAMSPVLNLYGQLKAEIESYERIKAKDWDYLYRLAELRQIGRLFIALRIAYGLTQRDLATLLGVSEAQVSKDERNEYHGISLERAMRIMAILNIDSPHLEFRKDLNKDRLLHG